MLTCKDMTTEAHALLDGDLGPMARIRIRFHLLLCKYCRRYVRQLALTLKVLEKNPALDEQTPTESEIDAVVEQLKLLNKTDK